MIIETYLGLISNLESYYNYKDKNLSLYNGFTKPQFSGTLKETIAYLENLKPSLLGRFSAKWEDSNGCHLQGTLAIDSIDNEITRIKHLI